MAEQTPMVVALAGPNGAGKSSIAARLLRGALGVREFVNADTIAAGLSAYRPETVAAAAGRIMLGRLRDLAEQRTSFAFETTLAGRGHARLLGELRAAGFHTHLVFLALPHVDLAIARVAERVRLGGHHVPDEVVRRRFRAGMRNLMRLYPAVMNTGQVYDNSGLGAPRLIASQSMDGPVRIADRPLWKTLKEQQ